MEINSFSFLRTGSVGQQALERQAAKAKKNGASVN
jgi:hypothetical protein